MKLYGFPQSTNVWLVRAVAEQLDLLLDFQVINAFKRELQTPEFLALNPSGRVPVLVDDDFVLWESNAIIQYLASQKPNSLWPDDIQTRADIMRWQSWHLSHWLQGCQPLQYQNFVKPMLRLGEPDTEVVKKATEIFHREAAMLDRYLSTRKYLVNDSLTLADFAVASGLPFARPARFPIDSYENIQTWFSRIESLPAWRETAPQM